MTNPRLSTYLEARRLLTERVDAPARSATGKTRRGVKCQPPNKKCGNRCIPANWNCRLTGGGLDSHSRVVQFDPIKGTNSLLRGSSNLVEGARTGNLLKITRGLGSIERGVIKLTPGTNAEAKQRLRKRVKAVLTVGFIGTVSAIAAVRSHQQLKNLGWYREGIGADIDNAARRATENVQDIWDAGTRRAGLYDKFGTRRAEIGAAGQAAASRLARQGIGEERFRSQFAPARTASYLNNRARLRTATKGATISRVKDVDVAALQEGWDLDRWTNEKTYRLYSQKTDKGHSVFAGPAAHELLASQWGFQLEPRKARQARPISEANEVKRLLRQSIASTHADLKADMKRRGLPLTEDGIRAYTDQMAVEVLPSFTRARTSVERNAMLGDMRRRMRTLLLADNSAKQASYANDVYTSTFSFFDEYFNDAARQLRPDENGRIRTRRQPDSPFFDAEYGLTKLHAGQGFMNGVLPKGSDQRSTAQFLNRYYHHTRVQFGGQRPSQTPPMRLSKPEIAIKYARSLSGEQITTPEQARQWFRRNGFNVTWR